MGDGIATIESSFWKTRKGLRDVEKAVIIFYGVFFADFGV